MEVASGVVGEAAGSFFALATAQINEMLSYVQEYNTNIEKLKIKRGELNDLMLEIEEHVKAGERELKKPAPAVVKWLEETKAFLEDDEWNDYMDEKKIKEKDQCCFGLLHWNLKYRYFVSKSAIEKSRITEEKIKEMKDRGSSAVSLPGGPLMLGSMPTAYSKSLPSRESTLNEIMEALKDKEVHVIGIYGMGGVGKTTLIEEVARRAEADGSFSEVTIAEVSQAPDVLKMQQQIAERIGLPLHDSKSADERARKIHERLRKKTLNEASDQTLKKGGSQVVVILDNIWKKLDLGRVGIPRHCKITLTTRSELVCREMGADKIIEVRGLDDTEATKLFLERARHPADHDEAYKSVTSELVKKCEGLPLAIAALADALRDRDLLVWKHVAAQLGRPVPARVGGAMEENVYPILEWSYNFISGDEKKKFFLLCCLFPLGSSIAVQDLMRYGAGLGLFQHMNSLDEAIEQANSWASELKSSSLLLEAEDEWHVKLQDVVRATSMSIASKGRNVFQVGSFPRLLMKETFRTYTAISMTKGHNHEPLSQFKFPKLEMLLLKGSWPSDKFSNNFFQGMKCLKVLVMSDMKFQTLPSSITQLKNLKTLHLERCDLSDISAIVKLVDLLFLSLRESTIVELPEKFENLVHLKLLDLTGCSKLRKIQVGVITSLTELEELYLMGSFESGGWDDEEKVANLIELKLLSYLAVLELHVPSINLLPDDLLFPQLSRFQISIGSRALNEFFSSYDQHYIGQQWKLSSQILLLESIEGSMLLKQSINCLLQKTECLILVEIRGLESVTGCLVNDGFKNLKRLYVENCHDMEYIASTNESNEEGVFPKLEELAVRDMHKLKGIYHGPDLYDDFCHLKKLILFSIDCIRSFWDDDKDNVQADKPFFNKKMKFPSLKELYIENVRGIVELWHLADVEEEVPAFPKLVNLGLWDLPELRSIWRSNDIITHRSFQNLKSLFVRDCPNLEMICPLSVATALEQLDTLWVKGNKNMKEIIAKETREMKNGDTEMIIFSKLQYLHMSLPNLKCFFGGSIKLVFPSLKVISCNNLKEMVAFVIPEYPENSNALFNDKKFQHVKKLELGGCEELFNREGRANAIPPRLRKFTLYNMPNLQRIPWMAFSVKSIHYLKIFEVHGLKFLFLASMYSDEFVQLEEIHIDGCRDLEQVFAQESIEDTSNNTTSTTIVLSRVKIIKLQKLPNLRSFNSENYHAVKFSSLEEVEIQRCPMMETFSYGSLSTPRLYKININWKNEEECFDLNAVIKKRKEAKETKSTEGETSREEGETSREGVKGEFVEGETSRGAKGESVEGETNEEDAKGESVEEEISREGAKKEFVEGETSGEDPKGESVEDKTSGEVIDV